MVLNLVVIGGGACALLAHNTMASPGAVCFLPAADTYVNSTAPTSNMGTSTTLVVNNYGGVKVLFLRFDLGGATGITRLRLELPATLATTAGQTFNVYGLTNGEAWSESATTWQTAPAVNTAFSGSSGGISQYLRTQDLYGGGTVLASFTTKGPSAIDTAFDVSDGPLLEFVNADADKVVTFVIVEQDPADSYAGNWNSRENAQAQPKLTVEAQRLGRTIKIFLLGGQSNAQGLAPTSDLPTSPINLQQPQPDVLLYDYYEGQAANADGSLGSLGTLRPNSSGGDTFGPEILLGRELANGYGYDTNICVAIIKFAKGGTTLATDWYPGGDATQNGDGPRYCTFQDVVRGGLSHIAGRQPGVALDLAGMFWVQGESDIQSSSSDAANAYSNNLVRFIADVRCTFRTNLPFFLTRVSCNQSDLTNSSGWYTNYLTVRAAEAGVPTVVPATFMVDTDGAAFGVNSDGLHFNAIGQEAIGRAFAQAFLANFPPPFSFTRISGSMAEAIHFEVSGPTNLSYSVEAAAALNNPQGWATLQTSMSVTNGRLCFDDPSASNYPSRFYRLKLAR